MYCVIIQNIPSYLLKTNMLNIILLFMLKKLTFTVNRKLYICNNRCQKNVVQVKPLKSLQQTNG